MRFFEKKCYNILIILFIIIFILLCNNSKTYAATQDKTYVVSNTITATLDTDGVLTISGTGEMPEYSATEIPWKDDSIKKLVIKSGITKIGAQNFINCTTLTQIELGNTITSIDNKAFAGCSGLTNVTLPSSIQTLGERSFAYCTNLSSIYLNEGLKDIDVYAFQNTKLKMVEIPSTLINIGVDTFLNVTTIETFSVRGGNNETFYTDEGVLYNHKINQSTGKYLTNKELVCYPVASNMTSYAILNGTTDIGQDAFKNALNLQQVTIPESINKISAMAFSNTGLRTITIPAITLNVTGPEMFSNNKYLKTVDFKANLDLVMFGGTKKLQYGAFKDCTVLEKVTFSGEIEEFDTSCFEGCTSLTQIAFPSTLKIIGMNCFKNNSGLANINLPDGLETIKENAFCNCTNLNQVSFTDSLIEVHKTAFSNCSKVTSKYPANFELKADNYYRETTFVTISGIYDYEQAYKVFGIVNQERKKQNLNELKFDVDIANAAMKRAAEISLYYSHTRPNSSDFNTILTEIRQNDSMSGENIAISFSSPEAVMEGWMNSSGHKANILRSNFKTMGVGCYKDSVGRLYWVQLFVAGEPSNTDLSSFKGTKAITNKIEITPKYFNIKLNNSNDYSYVGETSNINMQLLNSGYSGLYTYAKNSDVIYTIEDPTICRLEDGDNSYTKKLTYLKEGSTKLTATINGKSSTIIVTAHKRTYPLKNIKLSSNLISLDEGETYNLEITYDPSNTTDDKTITWESLDSSVASVDKSGKVTAVKKGNTYIRATVGKYERLCRVIVSEWSQFDDVKSSDWFYNAVKYTYQNNIIKGYNTTTFAPNDKLTRGMIVTMLYRMEGSPNNDGKSKFTDVSSNEYYAKAVKWAANAGIIHGYEGTTKFGPEDNILRQDLAGILRNYANYKKKNTNVKTDISKFRDYKKVDSYAISAIQWAVGNGVITGNDNGTLNPTGTATRAEVAAMIQKYCQKVGR